MSRSRYGTISENVLCGRFSCAFVCSTCVARRAEDRPGGARRLGAQPPDPEPPDLVVVANQVCWL